MHAFHGVAGHFAYVYSAFMPPNSRQGETLKILESRIVRPKEVTERLGIGRVTLWRWVRAGKFPQSRQIGPNIVGWLESEIETWFETTAPQPPDEA